MPWWSQWCHGSDGAVVGQRPCRAAVTERRALSLYGSVNKVQVCGVVVGFAIVTLPSSRVVRQSSSAVCVDVGLLDVVVMVQLS